MRTIFTVLFITLFCLSAVWADQSNIRDEAEAAAGPIIKELNPNYRAPIRSVEMLLYDNGPLVNSPGTGPGGADESILQNSTLGMGTLGFGNQFLSNNHMADDFTITDPAGWTIDSLIFFAYQTGSTTTSTITGLYYQIWNGPPDDPMSMIVFGDLTTNRLIHTEFSNIYRISQTTPGTTRPIMKNTASCGVTLPPGTYWLDWLTDGSLSSGPWAPPITINGQTITGNALQYVGSSATWNPANDSGTLTQQGMPFLIYGEIATLTPQWSYGITQVIDGGNPRGIKTDSDAPGLAGYDTLAGPSQSANFWSEPYEIPFYFEYFGHPVTHLKVSQNCLLTFDTAAVALPNENRNLPTDQLPDWTIAVFWDEFTSAPPTGTNDRIVARVYGTAPERQLWIIWYSFEYGNPYISYVYNACVLEEISNKIYIVDMYSSTTPALTSTVGIQFTSSHAVQFGDSLITVSGNGASYLDNDYYEFYPLYENNYQVNWVACEEDIVVVGNSYTVEAEVENAGTLAQSNVPVRLFENGMQVGEVLVSLAPGEKDTIQFTYVPMYTDNIDLMAQSFLVNDQNPANDIRHTTVYGLPSGSTVSVVALSSGIINDTINNTLPPLLDTLTLVGPPNAVIIDIELIIDSLTHTYCSDIDMFMIGANGVSLELSTDNGGSGDNYIGTVFDDQASLSITQGVAPFTGFFRPEGYPPGFAQYRGLPATGDWVLNITDDASGDNGTLHQWSMVFTIAVLPPTATLPFEEGFNDTTLLGDIPTGWIQVDADGGDEVPGVGWGITQSTNLPLLEGPAYIRNLYLSANSAGLIDEWLISPKLLNYQSGMQLSFWLNHIDNIWDDSVMVLVSTTDTSLSSFTQIDYINCPVVWTEYTYNLENYGVTPGSDFYLAFRYYHTSGGSYGNNSNWFGMDYVKVDYPPVTSAPVILAAQIGGDSQYRSFWVNGSWDSLGVYDPNWSAPMVELKDDGVAPDAVAGDHIFTGLVNLEIDAVNTYHWWVGSENDDNSFLDDGVGFMVSSTDPVYPDTLVVDGDNGINEWVISLPGSFNGWNPSALDMTRQGTKWTAVVQLDPGTYEYKYAVMHQWRAAYGNGGVGGGIPNYSLTVVSYGGSYLFTFDDADNSQSVIPYIPPLFFDDFEAYTAGVQLALQTANWTTWSGMPGSGEDPYVTTAHARSGVQSVVIVQNNDLVKTYGSLTTGHYEISFYVYIPTGKAGYFNTLSGFTPNPYEWAMECYFDQPGTGRLFGGSPTAVPFSYPHDTWFHVQVIVNLNTNLAEVHINDMLIHSWQWTLGASGGGSTLRLDGTDLFGATVNDEMYVDDFGITRLDVPTGILEPIAEIPTEFGLDQNYPNPFNPTTTIKYALKENVQVTLKVYNMLGQEVRTLVNGWQEAGYKQVVWDGLNNNGSPVASGIYIYQIQAGDFVKAYKMILMK